MSTVLIVIGAVAIALLIGAACYAQIKGPEEEAGLQLARLYGYDGPANFERSAGAVRVSDFPLPASHQQRVAPQPAQAQAAV